MAVLPLLVLLTACSMPGSAAPVLKLGVIAPFEGQGQALGYAVLPAVKEAVAEANASGRLGPYRVLVVAFNDNLDPAAARQQARALALDPDVIGVIGPFTEETRRAAMPVLLGRDFPVLPIEGSFPVDGNFAYARDQAKAATAALLDGLADQIRRAGRPDYRRP